jgi:hypothetical protein
MDSQNVTNLYEPRPMLRLGIIGVTNIERLSIAGQLVYAAFINDAYPIR